MFSRSILLSLLFIVISSLGFSQKKDEYKQPRILILLDGSSSMINEWTKGENRFHAAGNIILRLMDSIYQINDQVEFSLRVYGHEHGVPENNCLDTKREVLFSRNNLTQMSLRLESLRPMGVSPIAYSLKEAAEKDFDNTRDYAYSLVLVTDGGESCGGNICDVVKTLLDKKIEFRPYIVSLVDYAPLKDQYNCLGNYLTVSKPSEITPAIHTIAEAYRKVLAVPIVKPKLLQTANIPSPSVQKISVPSVKVPVKEPETTVVLKQPVKELPKPQPAASDPSPSKIQVETSFFTKEKITGIRRLGYNRIKYQLFWSSDMPKKKPVPRFPLPEKEAEPGAASTPIPPQPKPQAPVATSKPPAPKPAPRPGKVSPMATKKNEVKEAVFTTKLEPAPETLLEVYFTDGRGKYYATTPPMQLLDAKTGHEVKKFYRTTDANGNPDPQKVPPGNFTLVIGKNEHFIAKNITVQPSNHNKIYIVVTKASLSFRYDDNPTRPVKEFLASVKKTFEYGQPTIQKCTDELEYESANYHIEINTVPVMIRNVDLDFGSNVTIDIPEPGFVKFTNTNRIGKISLWTPLGDQFVKFYGMEINGVAQAQKLQLQPGIYEVHWKRNPTHPMEPDVVQTFYIKSNEATDVELK